MRIHAVLAKIQQPSIEYTTQGGGEEDEDKAS